MTDQTPLDELYRWIEWAQSLPPVVRWFEVAPDVWDTWRRGEHYDPQVVELVRRGAGLGRLGAADVHVRDEFPPGQWIAYGGDGEELGRGEPT